MKRKLLFGALLLLATLLTLPARGEVKSFTITFLDNGTESDGGTISNDYIYVSGDAPSGNFGVSDNKKIKVARKGLGFKIDGSSSTTTLTVTFPQINVAMVKVAMVREEEAVQPKCNGAAPYYVNWDGNMGEMVQDAFSGPGQEFLGRNNLQIGAAKGIVYVTSATVYYLDSGSYTGYGRMVTAGNYGTICLPRAVAAGNHTPATIYRIAEKKSDGSAIVLEEVTGGMEAGMPYIFRTELPYFSCYQTGDATAVAGSDNGLIGSFDGTEVAEGMYMLSNNKVSLCGTGCSIGSNRAYINLEAISCVPAAAGAKRIAIGVGDGTGIEMQTRADDDVWYDLLGHRVQQPSKGLYICNGKKVFVK